MKIYIVTTGEYSDYRIAKVFIDKERAIKYKHFKKEAEIEIWDTEERDFKEINYIQANLDSDGDYNFEYLCTNTIDEIERIDEFGDTGIEEGFNFYDYSVSGDFISYSLNLVRILPETSYSLKERDKLELKYKKILEDKLEEIKSLVLNENWNLKMIYNWLDKQNKER